MKKIIAILLMMVMLVMLVVGCVSRQNYDALMSEYDGLRARVESLQNESQTLQSNLAAEQSKSTGLESDVAAAQAKNSEIASSLEETQKELEGTKGDLTAAKAKNSELTSNLEKSQTELQAIKTENKDLEEASTKLKRFTFFLTALCSKEPKAGGEFIKQPDNTFKTNDTIWVYFDYIGWKYLVKGQEVQVNNRTSIAISEAEGEILADEQWSRFENHKIPWGATWVAEPFGPFDVGNYIVKVEVTDGNSGETITWEEEFQVVQR